MTPEQDAFYQEYLSTLSEREREAIPQVEAEYFCADEYNANACAELVMQGKKVATCSLHSAWFAENEPLPVEGRITVVLDWNEKPVCIIKTNNVEICPFNQVTEEFALAEGEGDGTYQWWYDAHWAFFTKYAKELNLEFNQESNLVLERFEKVYPL